MYVFALDLEEGNNFDKKYQIFKRILLWLQFFSYQEKKVAHNDENCLFICVTETEE